MNILKVLTDKRKIGNFGERAAAKMLRRSGYKVLKKNYCTENGEIDIIAKNREYTVFVEVKTRRQGLDTLVQPRAACSVTPEKQRKIIRVASYYLSYNPTPLKVRFDVVEVYYDEALGRRKLSTINHIEGAFSKSTARKVNIRR